MDGCFAVMGFTARNGKITAIDVVAGSKRLRHFDLTILSD
jgi:hypothetical protein